MGKTKVDSGKRNKSTQNRNHSSTGEDDHDHVVVGGKQQSWKEKTLVLWEEIFDSDSDDVVIIGDVAADSSSSGSWFNVRLRAIENVISSEEPIDVEKLEYFVDPLKSQQDQLTDTTESEASSDEDK
ncbi:hypothetical protein KY290_002751 [Solanum tuberosum]|uniref:Uncharacterized protein n=1 Tax=Solanum tuberosum TaxID=4113 RepID=A0ABQ7WQY8_SOLTU|nr:hypothetical protein KY290_002751 [Solanum tuberosum]